MSLKLNHTVLYCSLLLLFSYSVFYFLFGEKLLVNGGLGWDGVTYASYASNFWHELKNTNDVYRIDRTFPSLIIYYITSILHISLNFNKPQLIFNSFYIYNNILCLGCAYLWFKICKLKSFLLPTYLIGFISLFLNFAYLKNTQFSAVQTDITAFFFGFLVLYFFLQKKYFLISLFSLPACFTWPVIMPLLLPLFIFTKSETAVEKKLLLNNRLSIAITMLFLFIVVTLTYILGRNIPALGTFSISHAALPVSIIISTLYIYFIFANSRIFSFPIKAFVVNRYNCILYVVLMLMYVTLWHWLKYQSIHYQTEHPLVTPHSFLQHIILGSVSKPGISIISSITYYGPGMLLLYIFMQKIFKYAAQENIGLTIFVLLTWVMALDAQARQIIFSMPFLIYLLCCVVEEFKINYKTVGLYLLASIIQSKIYYVLNPVGATEKQLIEPMQFQSLFMNLGDWVTWHSYFIIACLVIISSLITLYAFKNTLRV